MPQTRNNVRAMKAVDWEADHYEEIPVVVVACLRWTAYGPIVSGWRPPFPPFLAAIYYGSIFSRRPEHAARRARDGTRRVADGDAALGRFARETGARAAALSRLPRLSPWGWPIGRYGPSHARAGGGRALRQVQESAVPGTTRPA